MNTDCTFFLSTYDGGEDLWKGFFKALSVQWPEMDMPIALSTETKSYDYPGYEIRALNSGKRRIPWAKRLRRALERVDTEFILLFLEDFWLDSKVDDARFRQVLAWMKENPDVSTVSFYPCLPGENIDDGKLEGFELRPDTCEYKLNCQVALWRREKLIEYIRPHESPWEFEIYGSKRASRYKERFYTYKTYTDLVFSYGDPNVGCLIHRGKWVEDVARRLDAMYDLHTDFSVRGFEDFDTVWIPEKHTKLRIFLYKIKLKLRELRSTI